jgi:hypothetical protein
MFIGESMMNYPAGVANVGASMNVQPGGRPQLSAAAEKTDKSFAKAFAAILREPAQAAAAGTSTASGTDAVQATPSNILTTDAKASSPPASTNSVFFGYNGKAYTLAPPAGDSFLGSNGQTYTRQEIKNFYAKNPNFGDDIAMMARLGLKSPDLYKARYLAGQTDTNGTGIYADPKELEPYSKYLHSSTATDEGASKAMAFDEWRNSQDPIYLAALQTGPNDNIAWINGPVGGVAVGGAGAVKSTSTLELADQNSRTLILT